MDQNLRIKGFVPFLPFTFVLLHLFDFSSEEEKEQKEEKEDEMKKKKRRRKIRKEVKKIMYNKK